MSSTKERTAAATHPDDDAIRETASWRQLELFARLERLDGSRPLRPGAGHIIVSWSGFDIRYPFRCRFMRRMSNPELNGKPFTRWWSLDSDIGKNPCREGMRMSESAVIAFSSEVESGSREENATDQ